MERRVRRSIDALGVTDPWLRPLNAGSDEDIAEVFKQIGDEFGKIDFLVHSIAYADKDWLQEGRFTTTPREGPTSRYRFL